jgi:hypothetical protein
VPAWGSGVAIPHATPVHVTQPRLVAADAGGVIAAWVADGYPSTTATGMAQKFDANGASLWGEGEPIAWSGAFNNVMDLVVLGDGAGGLVAGWVDGDVGSALPLKVRAQHLDGAGMARLERGGQTVIAEPRHRASSPAIAHDRSSGAIHVVWTERPNNPVAVYAQRLEADGRRAWGDQGKALQSHAENAYTRDLFALPAPDGVLAAWAGYGLQGGAAPQITVVRLDANGQHVFPGERVGLKRTPTDIHGPVVAPGAAGHAVFAWSDGRAVAPGVLDFDILAQNIRLDGTLGNPPEEAVFADGFDGQM